MHFDIWLFEIFFALLNHRVQRHLGPERVVHVQLVKRLKRLQGGVRGGPPGGPTFKKNCLGPLRGHIYSP